MTLPLGDNGRPGGGGTGLPLGNRGRTGAVGGPPAAASDAADPGAGSGGRPSASGRALEILRAAGSAATGAERGSGSGARDAGVAGGVEETVGDSPTGSRPSAAATTASAALIDVDTGGAASGGAGATGFDTGGAGWAVGVGSEVSAAGSSAGNAGGSEAGSTPTARASGSAGASTAAGASVLADCFFAAAFLAGVFLAAAFFLAGAFLAAVFSFAGAFFAAVFLTGFGSSGCSSRVKPSRSARRATMSEYASASEDEGPFAATPSTPQRSRTSWFVIPSSLASSWILIFFAATLRFNLSQSGFPRRCANQCTSHRLHKRPVCLLMFVMSSAPMSIRHARANARLVIAVSRHSPAT